MTRPSRGQRFRSLRAVDVSGLVLLAAPATGGFSANFPEGEAVTVEFDPPPHATAISARPDRYSELEALLVPENERLADKYVGYALVISLETLERHFTLVRDA